MRTKIKRFSVLAAWVAGVLYAMPCSSALTPEEIQALREKLPPPAAGTVRFKEDIQPIFEASCLRCHGVERPKGRFRLTTRANALSGGASGVAVIPGESEASPLIFYVARLVPDMEMPPEGKDEPLTAEQVGLLRTWIDQGAPWEEAEIEYPVLTMFSLAPAVQWFDISGDEGRFREHTGIKEGWSGGLQSFLWQEQISEKQRLTVQGHVFANPEEYKLDLLLEQQDLGFFRVGAERYREYYDDSGGVAPGLSPPGFALGEDLALDIGRAWLEAGWRVPGRPQATLRYEYRYREGAQSTLHWGDVGTISPEIDPFGSDAKKVYPGSRTVDERVHMASLDLAHEVNGVGIENEFRGEWYENDTRRRDLIFYEQGTGPEKLLITEELHEHWQLADSFRLEKQVLDWLFLSGGYHYSRLEGEYSLSVTPLYPSEFVRVPAEYFFTDSIVLEQDTHVLNANAQLGTWAGLSFYGGIQSEWLRQEGLGNVDIEFGDPVNGFLSFPARVGSDLERARVEERLGVRYTGIPLTVVFAEARAAQESIGQWEELQGQVYPFVRDTDASSDLGEGKIGFTVSPWQRASVTGQYRYREKDSSYTHLVDETFGFPNEGYSAFITGREIASQDVSMRLSLRPGPWLSTAFEYQFFRADYTAATDAAQFISPGGAILAGNHNSHSYSAHVGLTPWKRLRISGSVMARETETRTAQDVGAPVNSYEGTLYSLGGNANYLLNEKTDLIAGYTYTRADYEQESASVLPVGMVFDWHIVHGGVTRRISTNITASVQYRFYQYNEQNSEGMNNYTAHGVIASLAMTLP